jgi:hypothetical protein
MWVIRDDYMADVIEKSHTQHQTSDAGRAQTRTKWPSHCCREQRAVTSRPRPQAAVSHPLFTDQSDLWSLLIDTSMQMT